MELKRRPVKTILLSILFVSIVPLLSSCAQVPKPVASPPPPWRICAEGEDPAVTGCKKDKPAAAITIRGFHE